MLSTINIASWRPKIQRCLENGELNQARSKPDTVDRPVRTARTIVFFFFFLTHGPCEPLRPVTTLLHSSLSAVSRTTSGNGRPHQSTISFIHLLGGLPLRRSTSTMPGMVVFVSFLSGIRHIWPTNYSFLCFIMSTTVKFLCTAHTIVHYYNCTRYCSTQTVLLIFTFLQTDITSQMRPSGGIIIIIIIISTFINSARVTQCHNGAG